MFLKDIIEYDIVNYKKPSIFIAFPYCTFKCEKDCGEPVCHNNSLVDKPSIGISAQEIYELYTSNPLTHAIVMGGLEPFDSFKDMLEIIDLFRSNNIDDDIVIYTGYKEDEISSMVEQLKLYSNIIIKFGRFIPNQEQKYDEELGITLASPNQYAKRIS